MMVWHKLADAMTKEEAVRRLGEKIEEGKKLITAGKERRGESRIRHAEKYLAHIDDIMTTDIEVYPTAIEATGAELALVGDDRAAAEYKDAKGKDLSRVLSTACHTWEDGCD